jgi:hypothetical protein
MDPVDRRSSRCISKRAGKQGGVAPARCSAHTNPSIDDANLPFVDPLLLKLPPEAIMPSLVRHGDEPPARAVPYPLRNNRTPAPVPPVVIYQKAVGPGNILLLNFRSPSLPPIVDGYPDVFIDGRELDIGQDPVARGDDFVDEGVYSNDDNKTNNNVDATRTMRMTIHIFLRRITTMTPTDWTAHLRMTTTTSSLMLI